jgi:hypothetical protein
MALPGKRLGRIRVALEVSREARGCWEHLIPRGYVKYPVYPDYPPSSISCWSLMFHTPAMTILNPVS